MKSRKIIKLFYGIVFCSIVFTHSVLAEDDWGPQLNPPAPMRYKTLNGDNAAVNDTVDDNAADEIDGLPNRIAVRSESLPLLPAPVKKRTIKPVQFDRTLEPQDTILPSRFLEEDSSVKTPSVPKPVKKSVSDSVKKSLETGSTVSPLPSSTVPSNSGKTVSDGNVYYDNEYVVNSDTANAYSGTQYNNAANASGYMGEPIIRPFGTGYLDNLTFFAGTRAFKSEMDAANTGNFGFDEGVNWSAPINSACNVSAQFGLRAVQADIKGNLENNKRTRNQYFITAGAFKRDLCSNYQGGAAFDWYHDDLYGKLEVHQVRLELSARTFSNTEYGFQGSFGLNDDSNNYLKQRENYLRSTIDVPYSIFSDNSYQVFLRKHLFNGGIAEGRVGATEHGAIIISGSGEFPLNDSLAVKGSFRTMLPKESRYSGGLRRESWDVSVGIVYYFRGGGLTKVCNPCRPMFDVADSGSYFNRIKN